MSFSVSPASKSSQRTRKGNSQVIQAKGLEGLGSTPSCLGLPVTTREQVMRSQPLRSDDYK